MNDQELLAHAKLILNAQISDPEDCWKQGFEASINNLSDAANPYPPEAEEHGHWFEGWMVASLEEPNPFEEEGFIQQSASQEFARTYFQRAVEVGSAILLGFLCYEIAADIAI